MSKDKELFDLIKSLSKSEKRYFRLHNSFQNEPTKYSKLFDLMDKEEEYDKNRIKQAITQLNFNSIGQVKDYLYQNILKTLRASREDKSLDARLFNLILDAKILQERGLNEQSAKILDKAQTTAEAQEKTNILLEIIAQKYLNASENLVTGHEFEPNLKQIETLIKHQEEAFLYLDLNFQAFKIYQKNSRINTDDAIEALKKHPDLNIKKLPQSFQAKYRFYYTKALLHKLQSEFLQAYEYFCLMLDLWDEYPQIKKHGISDYIKTLANYLASCHTLEKYEVFPEIIKKIRSIKAQNIDQAAIQFQNASYFELLYFMNTNQFYTALQAVRKISKGLKDYEPRIGVGRKTTFYYNLALLHLFEGHFTDALDWLRKLALQKNTRQVIQRFARVMELILLFELENDKVWRKQLPILKDFLKGSGILHQFEELFLLYMDKVSQLYKKVRAQTIDHSKIRLHPIDKQSIFIDFHKAIGKIPKKDQEMIGFQEFSIWVEANATNKNFRQILKERLKKK